MATSSASIRTVYVEQEGMWWRMAYSAWVAMIHDWQQNGWAFIGNHPQARRLMGKPALIGCDGKGSDGRKQWYTRREHILVRSPVYWSEADIEAELNELEERNCTAATDSNPLEYNHADQGQTDHQRRGG